MNEVWAIVAGFEGLYEVSDLGRVRRVGQAHVSGKGQGGGARIGRLLKDQPAGDGYRIVFLWRQGQQHGRLVHVLVAAAFIGPCPEGQEVNHKNGSKADNSLGNLEYMTRSENMKHAYATGLRAKVYRLSPQEKDLARQLKLGGKGSRKIAAILGCHYKTVQAALREATSV